MSSVFRKAIDIEELGRTAVLAAGVPERDDRLPPTDELSSADLLARLSDDDVKQCSVRDGGIFIVTTIIVINIGMLIFS